MAGEHRLEIFSATVFDTFWTGLSVEWCSGESSKCHNSLADIMGKSNGYGAAHTGLIWFAGLRLDSAREEVLSALQNFFSLSIICFIVFSLRLSSTLLKHNTPSSHLTLSTSTTISRNNLNCLTDLSFASDCTAHIQHIAFFPLVFLSSLKMYPSGIARLGTGVPWRGQGMASAEKGWCMCVFGTFCFAAPV
ncbi:hypothetical protein BU23DRAFT_258451 [Bimuria novae-zelandiae CBS 107.79]|uniref:Uncharacterized protein n=1 Tax=Bimuria novae-zelandiae CBS 107.79 TaxID=1447943 RepID=A0A6A5UUS4_9PLEO|nr:hypothetical protein BU23DRAFT_258451 [Bimuria novae-zelandiae CBS 107.79]